MNELTNKTFAKAFELLSQPDAEKRVTGFVAKMILYFRYEEKVEALNNASLAKVIEEKVMGDLGIFSQKYVLLASALNRLDPTRLEKSDEADKI